MKKVTYKTLLKNHSTTSLLYCPCCGGEFSSNPSDYFYLQADDVMTCSEDCEFEPLQLVKKVVSYKQV